MRIRSIVPAVVLALAASVGTASAAEQFSVLEGILAEPMNTAELDDVRGAAHAGPLLTLNTESLPASLAPPPFTSDILPTMGFATVSSDGAVITMVGSDATLPHTPARGFEPGVGPR